VDRELMLLKLDVKPQERTEVSATPLLAPRTRSCRPRAFPPCSSPCIRPCRPPRTRSLHPRAPPFRAGESTPCSIYRIPLAASASPPLLHSLSLSLSSPSPSPSPSPFMAVRACPLPLALPSRSWSWSRSSRGDCGRGRELTHCGGKPLHNAWPEMRRIHRSAETHCSAENLLQCRELTHCGGEPALQAPRISPRAPAGVAKATIQQAAHALLSCCALLCSSCVASPETFKNWNGVLCGAGMGFRKWAVSPWWCGVQVTGTRERWWQSRGR